jgi:phage/plasmid-like protein (TIGR03299 family)
MSHEVESMAYNKAEAPWHGLGTPVTNKLSPHQMMVAAGVDWEVAKHDSVVHIGKEKIYTGTKALIRTTDHKVLSPSVGPDWEPVQNKDAFEFFKEFVATGDMNMETAGSLRGGEYVWVLAKTKDGFKLFGGDEVEAYLLFTNPHIYGRSLTVDFTPTRVVCMNTLMMALSKKSKQSVRLNHRQKFSADKVKELMGLAHMKLEDYKKAAEFLGSKRYTDKTVVEYFKEMFPVHVKEGQESKKEMSKLAKVAMDVLPNQPGAQYAEGSWWQAYNAVTYMTDHVLCREQDTRLVNAWYGQTRQTKIDGLNLALEMAKAA